MASAGSLGSAIAGDELAPDAFVLLKSLEGMLDLVQTQASFYGDARKRLVDAHIRSPTLTFVQGDKFYIQPSRDLRLLSEKMRVVAARLRQLEAERDNAKIITEAAFAQLQDENEHLREELTRLRQQELTPQQTDGC
jgi:hypothetical protein